MGLIGGNEETKKKKLKPNGAIYELWHSSIDDAAGVAEKLYLFGVEKKV